MENSRRTRRWGARLLVIGLTAMAVIALVLLGAWAWQSDVRSSSQAEYDTRTANVQLIKEAGDKGAAAADLLNRYAITGDTSLVPQIRSDVTAAEDSVTKAMANGTVTDLSPVGVQVAQLAQGVGEVVTLRQAGDVPGTVAALNKLAVAFKQTNTQGAAISQAELDRAASLQDSAQQADDWASRLLVALAIDASLLALSITALAVRSLARRSSRAASSA